MDNEIIEQISKMKEDAEQAAQAFNAACQKAAEAMREFAKTWEKGIEYIAIGTYRDG